MTYRLICFDEFRNMVAKPLAHTVYSPGSVGYYAYGDIDTAQCLCKSRIEPYFGCSCSKRTASDTTDAEIKSVNEADFEEDDGCSSILSDRINIGNTVHIDHNYTKTPFPVVADSADPSLKDLLDNCDLDEDFLAESGSSIQEILNDIMDSYDLPDFDQYVEHLDTGCLVPTKSTWCRYSSVYHSCGQFTSAGSTDTLLSTCSACFKGLMTTTAHDMISKSSCLLPDGVDEAVFDRKLREVLEYSKIYPGASAGESPVPGLCAEEYPARSADVPNASAGLGGLGFLPQVPVLLLERHPETSEGVRMPSTELYPKTSTETTDFTPDSMFSLSSSNGASDVSVCPQLEEKNPSTDLKSSNDRDCCPSPSPSPSSMCCLSEESDMDCSYTLAPSPLEEMLRSRCCTRNVYTQPGHVVALHKVAQLGSSEGCRDTANSFEVRPQTRSVTQSRDKRQVRKEGQVKKTQIETRGTMQTRSCEIRKREQNRCSSQTRQGLQRRRTLRSRNDVSKGRVMTRSRQRRGLETGEKRLSLKFSSVVWGALAKKNVVCRLQSLSPSSFNKACRRG